MDNKKSAEQINSELTDIQNKWYCELIDLAPWFCNDEYSNPHYVKVPDNWTERKYKIMVVGEEGHGDFGFGKLEKWGIEKIQSWVLDYLNTQIDKDLNGNSSPFWNRMRQISDLDSDNIAFVWNNIDKIYCLPPQKAPLSAKDRKKLHSTKIKILKEEVKITEPTIVVFFGFYRHSLNSELPNVYNAVYKDATKVSKGVYVTEDDNVIFILTWHPGDRNRTSEYEENVIFAVKKAMNKQF